MPTIINETLKTTPMQVRGLLEEHTLNGGVFIDIDRCVDYVADAARQCRIYADIARLISGMPMYTYTNRSDTQMILMRLGASEKDLQMRAGGGFSVDKNARKRIIANPNSSEALVEFTKAIDGWAIQARRMSGLQQYLKLPLLSSESYEGHRMALARPVWTVLNTGRISAKDPSLQNVPKLQADIITYPKSHILLFADSGQIEPRIKYSWQIKDPVIKQCIMVHNDAYYGLLQYITAPIEMLREWYKDPTTVTKMDLAVEDRSKLKTVLLAGSYGSALSGIDEGLLTKFRERITNHKLEIKLRSQIEDYVDGGGTKFYTAFGNEIDPTDNPNVAEEKVIPGTPLYRSHMINAGLNNPMQGTAADMMNEAILRAYLLISRYAKGHTWIACAKHDEGQFYIDYKDISLAEELADCFSYEVTLNGEKWIPIYSDAVIGKKTGDKNVKVI